MSRQCACAQASLLPRALSKPAFISCCTRLQMDAHACVAGGLKAWNICTLHGAYEALVFITGEGALNAWCLFKVSGTPLLACPVGTSTSEAGVHFMIRQLHT